MTKETVFIDPSYPVFGGDAMFESTDPFLDRDQQLMPYKRLRDHLSQRGYGVHTADLLVAGEHLGGMNHYYSMGALGNYQGLIGRPDVRLRSFAIYEPPVVAPHLYSALPELTEHFETVYVYNTEGDCYSLEDVDQSKLRKLFCPQAHDGVLDGLWSRPDRQRRLVMINSNKHPHPGAATGELYSERRHAVSYLAMFGEVDLYGYGWGTPEAREASFGYMWQDPGSRVLAAYRGVVASKYQTLSEYSFALCFENSSMRGYVTEKIFDCFVAGTIPVYLGAPDIEAYVPRDCFIDMRDFRTYLELRQFLMSLSDGEMASYRENARAFTESSSYDRFKSGSLYEEFDLPQVASGPLTSIVVLAYNKLEYTQLCIDSIRRYAPTGGYELIVVDNGSTDATAEWLREQGDISRIPLYPNAGAIPALNEGLRAARGDKVMFLNNDTVVTENWLQNLVACLESAPDIGAVCPVMNFCSYWQAVEASYRTLGEMQAFAKAWNVPDPLKWEERVKLIGVCLLMRREAVDKVGLFDELFNPGNFDDDDYSFRLVEAGYRLVLCKDTYIHHFGSTTYGDSSGAFRDILGRNRAKFAQKWGFDSWSSSSIAFDVIAAMGLPSEGAVSILHVNCGCGATLLQMRNLSPSARLFGIEPNPSAARIARAFAEVHVGSVADMELTFQGSLFDYIVISGIAADSVELPGTASKLSRYLADNGRMLAPR